MGALAAKEGWEGSDPGEPSHTLSVWLGKCLSLRLQLWVAHAVGFWS